MSSPVNNITAKNDLLYDKSLSYVANFGPADYCLFLIMLFTSMAIGVYFGFWKKRENTTAEYLQGNKRMNVIAVTISLAASQTSCVGVVVVPVEMYIFGINWYFAILACNVAVLILGWLVLPVFYENNISSCYEYLELRFNRAIRQILTIIFILNQVCFLPIIMFIPCLALSQTSGINVHLINGIVGGLCIFYTMFGGIKAVVWTDVVQFAVVFSTLLLVIIFGAVKVGGLSEVFRLSDEGHRFDINYTFDATTRATIWNSFAYGLLLWTTHLGLSQTCVQRIVSLPTLNDVKKSMVLFGLIFVIIMSMDCFIGFVMYAFYANCDPLRAGYVKKMDKLLPYYVQEIMGDIPGMSGFFIACVFSASLSTVSAMLNSTAGVLYFDYIKPYIKHTEARANCIMKFVILMFGFFSIISGFIVEQVHSIFRTLYVFQGAFVGTTFAIYLIGVLMPFIHGKAVIYSTIISIGGMLIITLGAINKNHLSPLPSSVEACTYVNQNLSVNMSAYTIPTDISNEKAFDIFDIAPNWYFTLNAIMVLIIAVILSYALPSDKECDEKLLAPIIRPLIRYKKAPTRDIEFE